MKRDRGELPLQVRLAPISGVNKVARTADLVWTSGAPVKRYDYRYDRDYLEVLSLDPKSVRMSRLTSGTAPLLDNHDRFSGVRGQIGVVDAASIKPPSATVRFSAREDVAPIWQDVQDKIIRSVSVGYVIHQIEMIPPAKPDDLWTYRAIDWEPYELSLVPIGADPGAFVRSDQDARNSKRFPCDFISSEQENRNMDEHTEEQTELATESSGGATRPPARDVQASQDDPPRGNARYAASIRERAKHAGLSDRVADLLIARNLPFQEACGFIVDEVAERHASSPQHRRSDPAMHTSDNSEGIVSVVLRDMSEALAARFGGPEAKSDAAQQYIGLRTIDLARQLLEIRGVRTTTMAPSKIYERVMGHSSSDFPNLLGAVANKFLRQAYNSYPGGARVIARKTTVPDFKAKQRLMFGEAPGLTLVRPSDEIQRGTIGESKESYAAQTYAKIFSINRQAIINDDLNAFGQLSQKWGRAAAEFEAGQIVSLLTSNPVLATDGVALFHANHGNLDSTSAIAVATLGTAKQKMRLQKGLDGKTPIDATPKYLLVPAALETIALQYVTQITPAQSSNVNPFTGQLEVVVDPRLDATSATQWYVASDPSLIDTIEYAYLEGQEGVYLETKQGFDIEGIDFKARVDFGAGVLDFRGLYRNG